MYKIDYQEEVSRFLDRKTHLEENMKKIYTEIFTKYCTRSMQQHLEEHPEFEDFEDDPIKTLEVIRNTTHDTVRAQYQWCQLWTLLLDGEMQDNMMKKTWLSTPRE